MISKKSKNASKFNNIFFPLIVTVISFSLTGACYLTVVRGIFTTLIVVLVCVFCDVGGFAAGIRFGKHKFAPIISPKKTWEGVIGSFIFSYVVFFTLMVLIGLGNGQSIYQMQGNLLGNQ
jgi:phosphatidate cytidylyltransferase